MFSITVFYILLSLFGPNVDDCFCDGCMSKTLEVYDGIPY